MGTLFNQPPRKMLSISENDIENEIETIKLMMDKYGITFLEAKEVLLLLEKKRKNDLYVVNGDIFDEQMHGIGELLQGINS